jgi:lipid A ethanolaminephosphotransferase
VWNDNQSGCKGVCTGVETMQPDPATLSDLCADGRCLDEALVESSRPLLRDSSGNLVLVLHQLGNHGPAYYRRYPQAFRRFVPTCDDEDLSHCSREQVTNSYDNALLYTDHVLGRTIDLLKEFEHDYDTAMLYVSDHGESLGENGLYLHGVPYAIAPQEQTQVPMVMWFSAGFAARNRLDLGCLRERAAQSASHDNLFHTVLGLLDVRTSVREDAMDLGTACRR